MKDLIDRILKYLPQYFIAFGGILAAPKEFIARLKMRGNDTFTDSLLFLAISLAFVVVMTAPVQPGKDLWNFVASQAIVFLFAVPLTALLIRFSWWLVGGRAATKVFFIAYAYIYGMMAVLSAGFLLISLGFFKLMNAPLFKAFMDAVQKGQAAPDFNGSNIPWIAFGLYVAGLTFLSAWLIVAWGAFRKLNRTTRARSAIAFVLANVLTIPALAVVIFVSTAVT